MFQRSIPIILLGIMVLVGTVGFDMLRMSNAASGPIEAIPLQLAPPEGVETTSEPAGRFEIVAQQSEARFIVDEVLNGSPNTVIGATNQVSGQLAVTPAQPSDAQVGAILIDARTLATDDALRNNALRRFILGTDQHPYITFTPTSIQGLPSSAALGQTYTVAVVGQLAIRDVAREATFVAQVTPISATKLEGTASTSIAYADWGLSIPQLPFIASVSDQVRLELTFVAATV